MNKKYALLFVFLVILLITLIFGVLSPIGLSFWSDAPEKSRDTLHIITEVNPPYSYVNPAGEIKGSMVELVKQLAVNTNTPYSLELLSWSSGYGRVLSTPNYAIFPTAKTSDRASLFKWAGPVSSMDYAFFCRSDNPVSGLSDDEIGNAGIIAVPRATARHQMLQDEKITNLLVLPSDDKCIQAVLNKDADLWLGSVNMYSQDRGSFGDNLHSLRMVYPWKRVQLYIAFNSDTPDDVVQAWQTALDTFDPAVNDQIMMQNFPFYCSWIDCTYCEESEPAEIRNTSCRTTHCK